MFLLEALEENPSPHLFQLLEATRTPWLCPLPSSKPVIMSLQPLLHIFSDSDSPASLFHLEEHLWSHWTHSGQNHLPISMSIKSTSNLNSPSPYDTTYSQVPRTRMWTSQEEGWSFHLPPSVIASVGLKKICPLPLMGFPMALPAIQITQRIRTYHSYFNNFTYTKCLGGKEFPPFLFLLPIAGFFCSPNLHQPSWNSSPKTPAHSTSYILL